MNKDNMFFLAGFPRAGSTLIANILAENSLFHVTPTSGLIEDIKSYRDNWMKNGLHKTSDEIYMNTKIRGALKGLLYGFHEDAISNNQIVIEKNRAWTTEIFMLEDILGKKIKIIFPIRNVIDILISLEKLKRKSKINSYGDMGNAINELSTVGRAENLLAKNNFVGMTIEVLRDLDYSGLTDRLIFVSYEKFLNEPENMFRAIYNRLEIPYFEHDFNNVKQHTKESDLFHGYVPGILHNIREGAITKPAPRDLSIFKEDYMLDIELNRYKDITELILNLNNQTLV
jgi:sulfotransferase